MSERIADALSEIGGEKVDGHLLDLLADPAVDANIRVSIATALGASGERVVTPKLLDLLTDDVTRPLGVPCHVLALKLAEALQKYPPCAQENRGDGHPEYKDYQRKPFEIR